jgi:hypothetical protein
LPQAGVDGPQQPLAEVGRVLLHRHSLAPGPTYPQGALNEHPRVVGPRKYRYHSPLISAEWGAFTNEPWGRGQIDFAPEEAGRAMETYATWARLFELMPYYSWIVDRFHLSARAYQLRVNGVDYDFRWLEERLLPLGFRLVVCVRSPDSFVAARQDRLKVSGNPRQYDDLDIFVREQELLRRLASESSLPRFEVDLSDDDVAGAIERVADWLERTGGLWAPWHHPTSAGSGQSRP